jgi:hypothetical protein
MFKVHHGTPTTSRPSLCHTCRLATVIRGQSLDQEIIQCAALSQPNRRVTFHVSDCNRYDDRAQPSLNAMSSIAWELRTDISGKRIGFMSPDDQQARAKQLRHITRPLMTPWGDED